MYRYVEVQHALGNTELEDRKKYMRGIEVCYHPPKILGCEMYSQLKKYFLMEKNKGCYKF